MRQHLPAIVVVLVILLQFWTSWLVGRARGMHGIKAPATSGHPEFERAFRVQMNTIEGTLMFLPALWLAATYSAPLWAGLVGLVWIAGRVWYGMAYIKDPSSRSGGFGVAAAALIAELLIGLIGLIRVIAVS